jgi:hypothetical protein
MFIEISCSSQRSDAGKIEEVILMIGCLTGEI